MLRVILATLGVALIAFGLFGGKSLEQVYAGLNGMFDKYSGSGDTEQILAEASDTSNTAITPIESTASVAASKKPTPTVAQSDNTDNEIARPQTGLDKVAVAASEGESDLQQDSSEPVLASAATSSEQKTDSGDQLAGTAANEPVVSASADNGAIDGAALKEVKASARNEELRVANQGAELPKEAKVDEILQTTAGDNAVKALFVLKDLVNMREGPSIDHPVVLRLEKGQELMEFKRDGKWVHVGAYGTSGKIGWVHERLVGK